MKNQRHPQLLGQGPDGIRSWPLTSIVSSSRWKTLSCPGFLRGKWLDVFRKASKAIAQGWAEFILDKEKRREIFTLYYQEPFPQAVILKRWLFLFCFPGGVASVHKWLTKNIVPFSYDLLGLFLRIWISSMTHMETKEC